MTNTLTVGDLMTRNPSTIRPQDSLAKADNLMNTLHVRHLPVLTYDQELVGLITHRDLLRGALFAARDLPYSEQIELLKATTVAEILTTDPETVDEDTSIEEAGNLLIENKYGCLPVLRGQKLVGILTETDFVKHVLGWRHADTEDWSLEDTPTL